MDGAEEESAPHTSTAAPEPQGSESSASTPQRGVGAVTSEEFSALAAVGGVRGLAESVLPGLVFVIIYVITFSLPPALIGSLGVAVIATVARLISGTSLQQAVAGFGGVAIGALWAWRTGEAQDFFAFGLWTNGAYLVACIVSMILRWPLVGLIIGVLTGSPNELGANTRRWRANPVQRRAYTWATGVWAILFGARLAVQLPLYFGASVGWLGSMRLVMGVPLWALALWITWLLVRGPMRLEEEK